MKDVQPDLGLLSGVVLAERQALTEETGGAVTYGPDPDKNGGFVWLVDTGDGKPRTFGSRLDAVAWWRHAQERKDA